ncbi:hypothetical protein SRABI106_02041 [Rahnella aquatilis]|nr:hypothetical protein SRABI106_02041 [Rahnella aquatilis]
MRLFAFIELLTPTFHIQLIDSCERPGGKVMPVVREPEDECASSFSALP